MTEAGTHNGPIRTCVGCRRRDQQNALVRVSREPSGRLAVDVRRRQPGRGAYVHPAVACLDANAVRVGLARSFRARIHNEDVRALCAQVRGQSK